MSRDQNHQTFGGWIYQKHLCLISNEEKRGHRYTLEYWLEVHPHCVDSTWLLAIKKYSDNVVRIGSHRPCWRMSDATLACALIQSTHFKCPFATISDGLKGRDKEQGVRAAFISHILALDSNQRWTIGTNHTKAFSETVKMGFFLCAFHRFSVKIENLVQDCRSWVCKELFKELKKEILYLNF